MRYLITYIQNKKLEAFYTDWFIYENNFNNDLKMVVYDLNKSTYSINGIDFNPIMIDHL